MLTPEIPPRLLQDRLDAITEQTRRLVQAERLAPSERFVAELFASGAEERILPAGAKAPEFALPDASGRTVRSADLLALGPLVLSFFRGRWCSYCVHELEVWGEHYDDLRAARALLLAVSPQTVRQNHFTAAQHGLAFPVLSDGGATVAEQFGLVYTVPPALQRYYRSILINVPLMNGEPSYRLPLPATFVIGQDGLILFARAYADFRVRPEPAEVVAALP